jgi:Rod binding domain-containing protein
MPGFRSDLPLSNMHAGIESYEPEQASEAASGLEAYFLRRVLAEVRPSQGGLFGQGFAAEMFADLLDEALADAVVKAGGVGLSDLVEAELLGEPTAPMAPPNRALKAYASVDGNGNAKEATASQEKSDIRSSRSLGSGRTMGWRSHANR